MGKGTACRHHQRISSRRKSYKNFRAAKPTNATPLHLLTNSDHKPKTRHSITDNGYLVLISNKIKL